MPSELSPGVDMVSVPRFEESLRRYGHRLLQRLFTRRELAHAPEGGRSLAARFAAKEAFLKAIGTGLAQGVGWHDVEVLREPGGPPRLEIGGRAAELLAGRSAKVSLSHTDELAAAFVIVGGEER
ncbi:MAG: holo-ACP synthase [Candidatus Fermentibacteraceae bacterium]